MPAPTNTSLATAIDIGTITGAGPTTVTETIRDGTTTYTTWYKYVAVSGDNVIGAWAWAGLRVGAPNGYLFLQVWLDATHQYLGISSIDRPIQFPVTAGTTYYFKIGPVGFNWATDPNPPITVTFSVRRHLAAYAPAGSLVVNDDTTGFPIAILSQTDGSALRFVQNVVAGERLAVFPDRDRFLLSDIASHTVKVYDHTFASVLNSIAFNGANGLQAHPDATHAYVGNTGAGAVHATVQQVESDFSLTTLWTLAAAGLASIAVNVAKTVLYYATTNTSAQPVKRWDLTSSPGSALADFLPTLTGYAVIWEGLLVLADDTLIVGYYQLTTQVVRLRRYQADGTIVSTWDFPDLTTFDVRLCRGLDDTTIWLWRKNNDGTSRFTHLRVSDGATLAECDAMEFEGGVYHGARTATPTAFFGHSESCHLGVLPMGLGIPPEIDGSWGDPTAGPLPSPAALSAPPAAVTFTSIVGPRVRTRPCGR